MTMLLRYAMLGYPNRVDVYDDREAPESRFRLGRFARLMPIIDRILSEKGNCRIADLGGTQYYWHLVLDQLRGRNIKITLINTEPTRSTIPEIFEECPGDVTCLSEHADNTFDLVHSNSVVEHVGSWSNMRKFAANARRLAPEYFVQTPNFWFPIEPHFRSVGFHWLPEQIRYRRSMARTLGFFDRTGSVDEAMANIQYCALIDQGQMQALFPDARIDKEKFLGMTKSLMAIRGPSG